MNGILFIGSCRIAHSLTVGRRVVRGLRCWSTRYVFFRVVQVSFPARTDYIVRAWFRVGTNSMKEEESPSTADVDTDEWRVAKIPADGHGTRGEIFYGLRPFLIRLVYCISLFCCVWSLRFFSVQWWQSKHTHTKHHTRDETRRERKKSMKIQSSPRAIKYKNT